MCDYRGKRACLYLPNRRRFVSVWRRAKAHLTPQRSSGNRPMKSTTSGIGCSVAPARSFAESPGEMIQEEMEQLRAMLDARQHSQLKKTG